MPTVPGAGGGAGGAGASAAAVARARAAALAAKATAAKAALTKAANAKATKGGSIPFWIQPPFDPRILNIAAPMGSGGGIKLTHGFMIWDQTHPDVGYGTHRARVNFLYNPTTVQASYTMSATAGVTAALTFNQGGLNVNPVMPMSQNVSFSLLFDRTFELWDSYTSGGVPKNLSGAKRSDERR